MTQEGNKSFVLPAEIIYEGGIPKLSINQGHDEELFLFMSQFVENTKLNLILTVDDTAQTFNPEDTPLFKLGVIKGMNMIFGPSDIKPTKKGMYKTE